jgi:hypothetical protein
MPQLERVATESEVIYRPKNRDSAGRDEQQQRAMDLEPRSGARALVPGGKEMIALGGNKVMPPPISEVDEQYAAKIAAAHAEYPRALYHRAFRRERDGSGKIIPDGEVFPLPTADAISPNYPMPLNIAQRNGIKGVISTSEGSPALIGQHLYRTCVVPSGWQLGDKINLEECRKEESELLKAAWVRSPGELNLPKPKKVEEESDE